MKKRAGESKKLGEKQDKIKKMEANLEQKGKSK